MPKFFVSGGLGFIGSAVIKKLANSNHEVVAIDSINTTLYAKEPRLRAYSELKKYRNVNVYIEDLMTANLSKLLTGVTHVVHLAAVPGLVPSWSETNEYFRNNTLASQRLAESIAKKQNIESAVLASTSSVYGELANGDENTPLKPISPYGISKLAAEFIWNSILNNQNSDTQSTILRYFSVYGPNQRPDMAIAKFLMAADQGYPIEVSGDGEQKRSFTYIDDIVDGTISALEKKPGSVLNLSGTQSIRLKDLIEVIKIVVGKDVIIKYSPKRRGDQFITNGNSILAKKLINFNPKVDIYEGIQRQWEELSLNRD